MISHLLSLGIMAKAICNVSMDVSIHSHEPFHFEWLLNNVTRPPLFKGIVILRVNLERARSPTQVGVLTAIAANATITTVTEDIHSLSPFS